MDIFIFICGGDGRQMTQARHVWETLLSNYIAERSICIHLSIRIGADDANRGALIQPGAAVSVRRIVGP